MPRAREKGPGAGVDDSNGLSSISTVCFDQHSRGGFSGQNWRLAVTNLDMVMTVSNTWIRLRAVGIS